MNRNIKLTVVVCLLAVALVFFFTYMRVTRNSEPAAVSPEQLREMGAMVYEQPVALSAFELQDHRGDSFTPQSLAGQWSLVFFGFTSCPDICPLTMMELAEFYRSADESVRRDTEVVMVSVDPFRDTPEKLADYVDGFHPDFVGVTGEYDDVAQLARQLYVAHATPPEAGSAQSYNIDHSGNILIINPQGQYHGFLESSINATRITEAYAAVRAAYDR